MPTILTHAMVPLAMGLGLGRERVSRPLLFAGMALSALPDLDVVGLRLGIPYGADLGHRGFSHALPVAVLVSLAVAWGLRRTGPGFLAAWAFLALSMASHGLLDALTTGGKGIALLWPFSSERFFAPVQVIRVAPLGLRRLLSSHGAEVLLSELRWVWLPCAGLALLLWGFRRALPAPASPEA